MYVYAGIDEAGYGPFFGPLVVGRCVLVVPKLEADSDPPDLWPRLSKAVCKTLSGRKGRIVVNDSKKLTTKAAGIKHLEAGCLAFAGLADDEPADVGAWLDLVGETSHRQLAHLPWYDGGDGTPWQALPAANTPGEIAIARGMLRSTCDRIGVGLGGGEGEGEEGAGGSGSGSGGGFGAAVVFEDVFNRMVAATHSKASVSFTQVARHLAHVWRCYGDCHPTVAVDRQGGRTSYRELLALNFPDTEITVFEETPQRSRYRLSQGGRSMRVGFEVEAERAHMPVALASMAAKYTRELLMARFNAWFGARCPDIRPTAGYGVDGKRFWQEIRPRLGGLGIDESVLKRQA